MKGFETLFILAKLKKSEMFLYKKGSHVNWSNGTLVK